MINYLRRKRMALRQFIFETRNRLSSPQSIFENIYEKNYWGDGESLSGTGSNLSQTRHVIKFLSALIKERQIKSILDIPCGDFNWMKEVDLQGVEYMGGDIVSSVIDRNNARYNRKGVSFIHIDLLTDSLPEADLILVRDCLVHFSNEHVFMALKNVARSQAKYLLTTTFPGRENVDIITGSWRPVSLEGEPFGLPQPLVLFREKNEESEGAYADKSLGLWEVDTLKKFFGV